MAEIWELAPDVDADFPAHGWVRGVTEVKLLRLPMIRLFKRSDHIAEYRTSKGAPDAKKVTARWLQFRSPEGTLRRLAICLRELHCEIREVGPLIHLNVTSDELTRRNRGCEHIEILLITAFMLLRRLADDLTAQSRPLLFNCWNSAPVKLAKLRKLAQTKGLHELRPICDLDTLLRALTHHTSWLDVLRRSGGGIRDKLIHNPHVLQISGHKSGDGPWRVTAHLIDEKIRATNLFEALTTCIDEACLFMQLLCEAVGMHKRYDRSDLIALIGQDDDVVGFWPPIQGVRPELPMPGDGKYVSHCWAGGKD